MSARAIRRKSGQGVDSDAAAPRSRALRAIDHAAATRRATCEDEIRRLVEAGFRAVRESGNLEPRVADIVRLAGLSNQAFYKHFPSKEDLLLAMLENGTFQLCSYVGHRMEGADTPAERVKAGLEAVLEQALRPSAAEATRPFALSRARLAERFPQEVFDSEARLAALFETALRDCQVRPRNRKGDSKAAKEVATQARLLHDLAMGWVERRLGEPAPPKRADARRLVDFALRGLGLAGETE